MLVALHHVRMRLVCLRVDILDHRLLLDDLLLHLLKQRSKLHHLLFDALYVIMSLLDIREDGARLAATIASY